MTAPLSVGNEACRARSCVSCTLNRTSLASLCLCVCVFVLWYVPVGRVRYLVLVGIAQTRYNHWLAAVGSTCVQRANSQDEASFICERMWKARNPPRHFLAGRECSRVDVGGLEKLEIIEACRDIRSLGSGGFTPMKLIAPLRPHRPGKTLEQHSRREHTNKGEIKLFAAQHRLARRYPEPHLVPAEASLDAANRVVP